MIKGLTCGAFDLLHAGHILFLRECKKQCDWLIVGLHIDPSIERTYKNKPIESVEERTLRLEGCRYVDEIFLYNTEEEWKHTMKEMKVDIRFHGADHKDDLHLSPEYSGIKAVYVPRDHDYGSYRLRMRIVQAHEAK